MGKKEEFIAQWKKLEELCERIFHPISGTPMDELFTRYMYFVRAKMGIVSSTTEALRKFYPLLIIMAFTVVLIMAIYGVAVARTATREIGK